MQQLIRNNTEKPREKHKLHKTETKTTDAQKLNRNLPQQQGNATYQNTNCNNTRVEKIT